MKKTLILALFFWVSLTNPTFASSFYLANDDITIDNVVDEAAWEDHKVITDKEDNDSRTQYCWDNSASTWNETTNEACETYLYDPLGQIDILDAWFGVNETNMVLAFETATPMFAIQNMSTGNYLAIYDPTFGETGITSLPEDFDHDMVFAFDTDPAVGNAISFDWYVVANIMYSLNGQTDDENFLQIFSESGDTEGFQADEDTLVDTLDSNNSETAEMMEPSAVMEIKQNIEHFYEVTGISSGDEVKFRLETHSNTGDTTKAVRVAFVDSNEIAEDAFVVGSGATSWNGRLASKYARGIVTGYAKDDRSILLQFEAYAKKVGVQVATGDVDGDGSMEIVTMPFRDQALPEWKVFDLTGTLEDSGVVPKKSGKRFNQYNLAVGDVTGDGQDDIVLGNAKGNRLMMDVLSYETGAFTRVAQYNEANVEHYARGVWVEVADINEDGTDDIITAPLRGSAVVEVWTLNNDTFSALTSYDLDTGNANFSTGLHIAAIDGAVLAVEHSATGQLHMLVWVDDAQSFETSSLDTITSEDALGVIGDIAWLHNGVYVYSSFADKTVTFHSYSGSGQEETVVEEVEVESRGTFVDFVDL